jgi:hypothetical protein
MKSIKKLSDLADKFESKLAKYGQAPIVSQQGTTELFFGDEGKQRAFHAAVQNGALAKFLTDTATKTQKTAGFDLKATAEPQKGASWLLSTNPPTLKGTISKLLDNEFKKIVGKSMAEQMQAANAAAKGGAGSGTLDITSFSADMD